MLVGIHTLPISYLHTMHYNILYVWFWLHGARLQCTPYEFCRNLRPYNSFSIYQAFFLGHPQAARKCILRRILCGKNKVFFSESAGHFSRSSHFTLVTFFAARFIFSPILLSSNNILLIFDRPIWLVQYINF